MASVYCDIRGNCSVEEIGADGFADVGAGGIPGVGLGEDVVRQALGAYPPSASWVTSKINSASAFISALAGRGGARLRNVGASIGSAAPDPLNAERPHDRVWGSVEPSPVSGQKYNQCVAFPFRNNKKERRRDRKVASKIKKGAAKWEGINPEVAGSLE
jgi:hypothetical protein